MLSEGPPVLVDPTELRSDGAAFDARTINSNYPAYQDVLLVGGANVPSTLRVNPISGTGGRNVVVMSMDMNGRECAWHNVTGTVHMEGIRNVPSSDGSTPEGDMFTCGNAKKWVVQNVYAPRSKGTDLNWHVNGTSGAGNSASVVSVTRTGVKTYRLITTSAPSVTSTVGRKISVSGSSLNGQIRPVQDRNWSYTITAIDDTNTIYDLAVYDLGDEYFVESYPLLIATGGTAWFYKSTKGSHSDTVQNEDGQLIEKIVFDHVRAMSNYQAGARIGQGPSPGAVYVRRCQYGHFLDIDPQEVNTQVFFAANDANVIFQDEVWVQPRFGRDAKFASIYPNKNTTNTTLEDGTPALTFTDLPYSGTVKIGAPLTAFVDPSSVGPGYTPPRWSGYVTPTAASITAITVDNLTIASSGGASTAIGLCDALVDANTMGEVIDITLVSDQSGKLVKPHATRQLGLSSYLGKGDYTFVLRATFRRNGAYKEQTFTLHVT